MPPSRSIVCQLLAAAIGRRSVQITVSEILIYRSERLSINLRVRMNLPAACCGELDPPMIKTQKAFHISSFKQVRDL